MLKPDQSSRPTSTMTLISLNKLEFVQLYLEHLDLSVVADQIEAMSEVF